VSDAQARLDALRDGIEAIRAALDQEYLAVLPGMIDRHDAAVREFCALPGASAFTTQVRALRDAQQALVEEMRERNARLLDLIRRQRQSSHAASAYAGAAAG
jgi:hypothetical protein